MVSAVWPCLKTVAAAALACWTPLWAVEVLGQGAAPGPLAWHVLTGVAVAKSGNAAAQSAYLGKLVSGEAIATVAFGGEWLPHSWDVTLSDGAVTGEVTFVPSAMSATLFLGGAGRVADWRWWRQARASPPRP